MGVYFEFQPARFGFFIFYCGDNIMATDDYDEFEDEEEDFDYDLDEESDYEWY